jgi:hypothetical protein
MVWYSFFSFFFSFFDRHSRATGGLPAVKADADAKAKANERESVEQAAPAALVTLVDGETSVRVEAGAVEVEAFCIPAGR